MIYLCSFKTYHEAKIELPQTRAWSAAIYQPKWFHPLPAATCWDIRRKGKWIRPREFLNKDKPHIAYSDYLDMVYESRKEEIGRWLEHVEREDGGAILCCWCPNDKAAQRQLKEFGSFVCHLSVIYRYLLRRKFATKFLDHLDTRLQFSLEYPEDTSEHWDEYW